VPRAGLTESIVVDAAERMADESGLSRVTLAALAAELGVRQPSLYKHVDGMPGLQRSIAVRAKLALAEVITGACAGLAREDALRAVAHAYRGWAREHPGRYAATVRAPTPGDEEDRAASARAFAAVGALLVGYGLEGDSAVHAARSLRAALHGFVTLEAAGGFGLPVAVQGSFDAMIDGLAAAMSLWESEEGR